MRDMRRSQGLGLNQLARMAGIAKGTLSFIENGHVLSPGANTLRAIGNALGVANVEIFFVDGV